MLAGVPVVQQPCGDEEGVVLVAALAVVPAAVVAHLGLASGESDGPLAACGGSRGRPECETTRLLPPSEPLDNDIIARSAPLRPLRWLFNPDVVAQVVFYC